ncbi:heterokaryon incompatibility protein-domain-containing protein [Xylaria arbuscula]|nr:heterokaryon incompatibility protein-domain-containing protein [Xylaria arbuscula]
MAEPQENPVCEQCWILLECASRLLDEKTAKDVDDIEFDAEWRADLFTNAPLSNCYMCWQIHNLRERHDQISMNSTQKRFCLGLRQYSQDHKYVSLGLKWLPIKYPKSMNSPDDAPWSAYMMLMNIQVANTHPIRRLTSDVTFSQEAISNLRFWMELCSSSHQQCKNTQTSGSLPLRLIDVMPNEPSRSTSARSLSESLSLTNTPGAHIMPTDGMAPDTPYLTLSHRWPTAPAFTLAKATEFLLQEDITSYLLRSDETVVFTHAIHVTRALGYRYLWIDAVCIMQDDEQEKTTEILRMDQIYARSTLNIAATEGNTDKGLMFVRNLLCINPCVVSVTNESDQPKLLEVVESEYFLGPYQGPLNIRGWVFQERRVATRTCHFTKDEMYWDCNTLSASEVLPMGYPDGYEHKSARIAIEDLVVLSKETAVETWYDVLEDYSFTATTHARDRLRALSAIANTFGVAMRLPSEEYLAGMWKSHLPFTLLWRVEEHDLIYAQQEGRCSAAFDRTELIEYAPSWSWASIDSQITMVLLTHESQSLRTIWPTVLDIRVVRTSPNPFDGLRVCQLRLRGSLVKCSRQPDRGINCIYVGLETRLYETNVDDGFHSVRHTSDRLHVQWDISREVVADLIAANENLSTGCAILLLPICTNVHKAEGGIESPWIRGIILQRTDARGTYVRSGYFHLIERQQQNYDGSELEQAFNGKLDTLDRDDYIHHHRDGTYTFVLV